MSDKKDFPHPEPPYRYIPGTLKFLLSVEKSFEKREKKLLFFFYFSFSFFLTGSAIISLGEIDSRAA
jgi:hypothetical protein